MPKITAFLWIDNLVVETAGLIIALSKHSRIIHNNHQGESVQ